MLSIPGITHHNEPMSRHTTFGIGGPADIFTEARNEDDVSNILRIAFANDMPVTVIGEGSNMLISDEGIRGITVKLASPFFKRCEIKGASVETGAGMALPALLMYMVGNSLTGMEPLAGIPGTVGGSVVGNAGARDTKGEGRYYRIGDLVREVRAADRDGSILTLGKDELAFTYRDSNLRGYVVLSVLFELETGDMMKGLFRLEEAIAFKHLHQEITAPSAGCIFKNPPGAIMPAGKLIDSCGLKGRRVGGAEVSERHANYIINRGGASASDVKELINIMRKEVKNAHGVSLELEVRIV